MNSGIFRQMFSLPQPMEVDGTLVEGCPIVHLQSDTAEDWAFVLKALYSGR
jgi:hypothetical protein